MKVELELAICASYAVSLLMAAGAYRVATLCVQLTHVGEVSGLKLEDDEVLADTDDVMSSAVVLGDVNPNKTYAVFSTTTENRDALQFIFLLPLTALAWKRIGFDSIIIIIGPVDVWNSDELFHFVLSVVRQLDAIVVFLEPRPEKSVMISQVETTFCYVAIQVGGHIMHFCAHSIRSYVKEIFLRFHVFNVFYHKNINIFS